MAGPHLTNGTYIDAITIAVDNNVCGSVERRRNCLHRFQGLLYFALGLNICDRRWLLIGILRLVGYSHTGSLCLPWPTAHQSRRSSAGEDIDTSGAVIAIVVVPATPFRAGSQSCCRQGCISRRRPPRLCNGWIECERRRGRRGRAASGSDGLWGRAYGCSASGRYAIDVFCGWCCWLSV